MKIPQKRFIIPLIIILAVLIIGGGLYYAKTGSLERSLNSSTASSTSLRNLFSSVGNMTCTFKGSDSSGSVSGKIYVAGLVMRGDLNIRNSSNGSVDTHILRSEGEVYLWSSTQGIKMTFVNFQLSEQSGNALVKLDENVKYVCSSWKEDDNKFKLPDGVIFMDIVPPSIK